MTMVAILFGLLTAAFGGRVLFGGDVRQVARAAVGFVVWFNFVSGFAYVVASLGLWWAFVATVRHPLIAIPAASLWANRPLALVMAGVRNGSGVPVRSLDLQTFDEPVMPAGTTMFLNDRFGDFSSAGG